MTVWKTAEANAWSRGFCYDEYVKTTCPAYEIRPVSVTLYLGLCTAFENEMEKDIGCQQTDGELT